MDDVSCSGEETSLDQCKFSPKSNCGHFEDVVVTCLGLNNLTVKEDYRLANPKNITFPNGTYKGVWGRAEVYYGNNWNQLCSLDFTIENADVICKSIGLPVNDTRFSNAELVNGNDLEDQRPSYNSNTYNCTGKESSLAKCASV